MSKTMSTERIFYVYILLDPRKPGPFKYKGKTFPFEPFYVGKGHGYRAWAHLQRSSAYVQNKIRKIQREGGQHIVHIFKENLSEEEAYCLEKKAVSIIGRKDLDKGPLVNLINGGDGRNNRGFIPTNKQRKVKSNSIKSHWASMTDDDYIKRVEAIKHGIKGMSKEVLRARALKAVAGRTELSIQKANITRKKWLEEEPLCEKEARYERALASRADTHKFNVKARLISDNETLIKEIAKKRRAAIRAGEKPTYSKWLRLLS